MSYGSLLIIIAAFLWAVDGLLRRSLYSLPSSTLIFFEHIVGLLLIAPFAYKSFRKAVFYKKDKIAFFTVSLLSWVIGTLFFTMALAAVGYIPMSVAILIQKLQPIFAIWVAIVVRHEKIPKWSYLYIVIALISGYFVTFPHGVSMTPEGQKEVTAALYALIAAAAWGSSTNISKYLLSRYQPELVTFVRFGLTSIIIALWLILIPSWREGFTLPGLTQWGYLLAIALSTGLVAMYIYYRGLRSTPVHVSAILELTWPIIAVWVDYYMYDTIFAPMQYLAIIVLMGSMYMVSALSKKSSPLPTD